MEQSYFLSECYRAHLLATLLLDIFFRRIGLFDETFVNRMNKFVFVIPCLCFCFRTSLKSISMRPGSKDGSFFCFAITSLSIMISVPCPVSLHLFRISRANLIQASYRSSAAIPGIAIIQNLYGNAGMAPLMIIASVPLYKCNGCCSSLSFKPGQGK